MTRMTMISGALIALFLVALLGIPASAYSAGATNLYNTGVDRTAAGEYEQAVASYQGALDIEPSYYEAWNGIADALNRNGQFNDALAASNRSLAIQPGYVRGWINRGQILYNIGYRYEEENNTVAAGTLYAGQLAAFEKAAALDPGNAEAWFNTGYALAGMRRYDEAVAAFDRVAILDPSYPNLRKNREIAVLLRDREGISPVITVPVSPAVAEKTTMPASPVQQPAGTTPRPSPMNDLAGLIAVLGTGFLLWQRK